MSEQPSLRERVAEAFRTNTVSTADMDDLRAGIALEEVGRHITEGLDEATEPLQYELGTGMALDLTRDILTAFGLLPSPEQEQ